MGDVGEATGADCELNLLACIIHTRERRGSFQTVPFVAVCFSAGVRRSPRYGAAREGEGIPKRLRGRGVAGTGKRTGVPATQAVAFLARGRPRLHFAEGKPRSGAAEVGDEGAVIPARGGAAGGAGRGGAGRGLPAASVTRAGRSEGNLCRHRRGLGLSSAPPVPGNDLSGWRHPASRARGFPAALAALLPRGGAALPCPVLPCPALLCSTRGTGPSVAAGGRLPFLSPVSPSTEDALWRWPSPCRVYPLRGGPAAGCALPGSGEARGGHCEARTDVGLFGAHSCLNPRC